MTRLQQLKDYRARLDGWVEETDFQFADKMTERQRYLWEKEVSNKVKEAADYMERLALRAEELSK